MDVRQPNFPKQINHPAHSQPNNLVLCRYYETAVDSTSSNCSVCRADLKEGDYIYACWTLSHPQCHFKVCIYCSSMKTRVAYFGHAHPIYFLERVHPDHPLKCDRCGKESRDLMFLCSETACDYNVHLRCGPLPVAIPYHYSGYDMTMTLSDALTDGVDPEDSWCDICEERRDPRERVYHSSDPLFTATVECLLSQIVGALQGDLGEVKLRSINHFTGVVQVATQGSPNAIVEMERNIETEPAEAEDGDYVTFSTDQYVVSMTLEDGLSWAYALEKLMESMVLRKQKPVITFKFSNKAFEQFNEHVGIVGTISVAFACSYVGKDVVYVKVGSNFVDVELVPLYRQLIDEHGDFTANSPLSPSSKKPFVLYMLKIIQIMFQKKIFKISGYELCTWQWYLELVRDELGFEVQFALDTLEKVAHYCYALRFIKVRDAIAADLTRRIERLAEDIDEAQPKLEALRGQYKRAKEESPFVKKCMFGVPKLQWKNAGEFLGLDLQED